VGIRRRFPVLSLVLSVLAVLLVFYEGTCLGAAILGGYPLTCVIHDGRLFLVLTILLGPSGLLVDFVWRRHAEAIRTRRKSKDRH
jgi:hypothetical protein